MYKDILVSLLTFWLGTVTETDEKESIKLLAEADWLINIKAN